MLLVFWLISASGLWLAERGAPASPVQNFGDALYRGIAAMSTAGIADTPVTAAGNLIGGGWIVIGSVLFFGPLVATVTSYFMRPLQRPAHQIVETIEYKLEHLPDLSVAELDLLKETTDGLILHVEKLRNNHQTGLAVTSATGWR
jgi:voltage-gated potassium channel